MLLRYQADIQRGRGPRQVVSVNRPACVGHKVAGTTHWVSESLAGYSGSIESGVLVNTVCLFGVETAEDGS